MKTSSDLVREFALKVQETAINEYNQDVSIDYERVLNSDESEYYDSAYITSNLGIVIIFPNCKALGAEASIINLGIINQMTKEGFSDEFIDEHGKFYGQMMPYNDENVKLIAYYLSNKL